MKLFCISLLLLTVRPLVAVGQPDSIYTNPILEFNVFMQLVAKHHPYSKIADLQADKGEYTVLKAKGNFDPELFAKGGQKYFEGDQYYSLLNGGVTIPTWFGIEVNAGYSSSDGYYLNPQNRLPETGLVYAGISVPLGKDLFIDKRRAELKKAKLYSTLTQYQQVNKQNEILLNAGITYWNWFWAFHEFEVYTTAFANNEERFNATKSAALFGDKPYIDTVEAFTQLQNRWLQMSQARVRLTEATNELNVFLWIDGVIPVELSPQTAPPSFEKINLPVAQNINLQELDSIINNHPEISMYELKLDIINIQESYFREQLKPKVDLNYNAINQPINGNPFAAYNVENYTWGIDVSFPIFLREERASLKLNQIDELETSYELSVKRQQLKQKTIFYNYEMNATHDQYGQFANNVAGYNQLVEAEINLFNNGESSLFMVNMRENAFIQSQIKLLEIIYKNQKAYLMFHFIIGNLYTSI